MTIVNEGPPTVRVEMDESLSQPASFTPALELESEMARIASRLPARYQVLSHIGTGGMGMVYKVRDLETDEIVALKILKPDVASDPAMQESLKKEVCMSRKVTHKNVCRIYEFNRSGGTASISMEFVEGESLQARLDGHRALSLLEALAIAKQICAGLREAHAQGIVHRDLKPANIMVDRAGVVKIMDFGIARLFQNTGQLTGTIAGTPAYMAPEQLELKPVGARADIYALGLLLYEMVTGIPAFTGDTPIAVALKQIREFPRRPREIVPTLPASVEAVIMRCLQKDSVRRFPSVDELAAALENRPLPKSAVFQWESVRLAIGDALLESERLLRAGFEKARSVAVPAWHSAAPKLEAAAHEVSRVLQCGIERAIAFLSQWNWKATFRTRTGRTVTASLGLVLFLICIIAFAPFGNRKSHAAANASEGPEAASSAQAVSTAGPQVSASADAALPAADNVNSGLVNLAPFAEEKRPARGSTGQAVGAPAFKPTSAAGSSAASQRKTPRSAPAITPATPPAVVAPPPPTVTSDSSAGDAPSSVKAEASSAGATPPPAAADPAPASPKSDVKTPSANPEAPPSFLEVASFKEATWADSAVEKLKQLGFRAVSVHKSRLWMQSFHVQLGPYTDAKEMEADRLRLVTQGFKSHPVK
jgi:predicted Ser/Thr protein kinase